jgi:hypothetical protein
MQAKQATTRIARAAGQRNNHVEPSEQHEDDYYIWLYLNDEPEDAWVKIFNEAGRKYGDICMRYEPHNGMPALALTGDVHSFEEIATRALKLIRKANSDRQKLAKEELQALRRWPERQRIAASLSEALDKIT